MRFYLELLIAGWMLFSGISRADTLPSVSFKVKVKAIDLSEDGVPGVTLNDEVFLFIYRQDGSSVYPKLLCAQFFRLDTTKKSRQFAVNTDSIQPFDTLTFLLLEQDSQKRIKGIEPVCRMYLEEMVSLYENNKTPGCLSDYIDDDDVLGMWRITGAKFDLSKPMVKKFESINFFDWAVYKLEIFK